jgi:hypothetical protein
MTGTAWTWGEIIRQADNRLIANSQGRFLLLPAA